MLLAAANDDERQQWIDALHRAVQSAPEWGGEGGIRRNTEDTIKQQSSRRRSYDFSAVMTAGAENGSGLSLSSAKTAIPATAAHEDGASTAMPTLHLAVKHNTIVAQDEVFGHCSIPLAAALR